MSGPWRHQMHRRWQQPCKQSIQISGRVGRLCSLFPPSVLTVHLATLISFDDPGFVGIAFFHKSEKQRVHPDLLHFDALTLYARENESRTVAVLNRSRLIMALLGPRQMSGLSPQSGKKRTLIRSLSRIIAIFVSTRP